MQRTQLGAVLGGLRWLVGHTARVRLGGVPPVVVVVVVIVIVVVFVFVFVVVVVVVVFIAVVVAVVVVVVGDARGSEMHWLTSFCRRGWWATQLGSASAVASPPSSSPLPWW